MQKSTIVKPFARKTDGSLRPLLEPDYLLKQIQRNLLCNVLERVPVSEYATAYRKGVSVRDNAAPHVASPEILKLDIESFLAVLPIPWFLRRLFPENTSLIQQRLS